MEVASGSSISTIVTYKECQKNHTISMGSHVKDGCAAFMPNITKENGLFCHACGCHRNFHRQEVKAVTGDALDAIPVAVHGKIHGGSSNSGITQRNPGTIKYESGLNSVIIDLEDVIDLSDDDPVITTESVSKRTAIKAKQRRFTEEEVKKMNEVCEFLDYKSPGKYGQGAERINRLCQEVGISRDSFRKYLYRRKEFRGTSRF